MAMEQRPDQGKGHVRRLILWVVGAILAATPLSSNAVSLPTQQIVAGPGAFAAGFSPSTIVIFKGQLLLFRNYDVARHNVWYKPDGSLFASPALSFAQTGYVNGVERLAPGTYKFFCTFHIGTMKGKLIVRKKL